MPSLSDLRWPDLAVPATAVVLPLGSVEQHGPHLPFDTDTAVAVELATRLVGRRPDFLLAPPVAYGASGEHEGFPGTLSIGCAALELLLVELGRSASRWAGRLLLVNGHGGNLAPLRAAVDRLRYEGRDVLGWTASWPAAASDAHAGRTETSLMLALRPAAVRTEQAVAGPAESLADLLPRIRAAGVAAVSPSGVLGDPAGATAEQGEALLRDLGDALDGEVDDWLGRR